MRRGAVVAFFVLGACKAKAGDACDPGAEICKDDHTRLVCVDGKYVETPCRGERGCFVTEKKTNCDISKNVAGDVCPPKERGRVACTDGNHYVACVDGKYAEYACGNGCLDDACDQAIAEEGSACLAEDGFACTPDKLHQLRCMDGRMVKVSDCRGPKKCEVRKDIVDCDGSRAEIGDACVLGSMDAYSCTVDGKRLLRCVAGSYALFEPCNGEKGCFLTGNTVYCDTSRAVAGDPCDPNAESSACTVDGKARLLCRDERWQIDASCKGACTIARVDETTWSTSCATK